jgi:hypothetical protein
MHASLAPLQRSAPLLGADRISDSLERVSSHMARTAYRRLRQGRPCPERRLQTSLVLLHLVTFYFLIFLPNA